MSHSAKKYKRGTLWDLLTYIQLPKRKNSKGGPFGDIKKRRTVPKKIQGGGALGTSGFVGFLEKEKTGDPLHSSCFVGYV